MKPERYRVKSISEVAEISAEQSISNETKNTIQELNKYKVDYIEPKKLKAPLSEDEIIAKLGAYDVTHGSCFSQALAYIANKAGYDVSDYRGGKGRGIFASSYYTIAKIVEQENKVYVDVSQAFDKLKNTLEYIVKYHRHAAIVRKVDDKLEYLELQSFGSGFKEIINGDTIFKRFCDIKLSDTRLKAYDLSVLEVNKIYNNAEVMKLLGFLNTKKASGLKWS